MILIHHHLGLGDHIICNGLVRQLVNQNKGFDISLACKKHNAVSVSSMYSDLNINFLIGDDNYILQNYKNFNKVYSIGFRQLNYYSGVNIEVQFYNLVNLDFNHKYISSKFPYKDRIENYSDHIFVHDDPSRSMNISINYDKIYRPTNQYSNILDYIPIMKSCKEIHVIESSFMHLVECLPEINENLFIHKVRKYYKPEQPVLRKNWKYV